MGEQQPRPGPSTKDKDHLLAKRRSVDDAKRVSNAAFAGLYDVQRRHQSREAALEEEIGAKRGGAEQGRLPLHAVYPL